MLLFGSVITIDGMIGGEISVCVSLRRVRVDEITGLEKGS